MRNLPAVKEQYPFESRWFRRGPWRQHFIDEGRGEPVLMLHGNPTWSFYYRRLIGELKKDRRVVAPDHIGCGLSDKPDVHEYPYTLASRVEDLDALLDGIGLKEPLTMVVHDWGGMIGLVWAARNPGRVKRLIAMNTAAFPLPAGKAVPWQLRLARTPLGTFLVRGLNAFCRGAASGCVTRRSLEKSVREAYLAPYDSWKNRAAVLRFVQDIPLAPGDAGFDLIESAAQGLAQFQNRPVKIFWGMRDFVFDGEFLAEWERRLPRASVRRFEDAGHYVLEDAHEEIIPELRLFLEENPIV